MFTKHDYCIVRLLMKTNSKFWKNMSKVLKIKRKTFVKILIKNCLSAFNKYFFLFYRNRLQGSNSALKILGS